MTRRAPTTIVLITREGLVRADFSKGAKPTLLNIWQEARPESDDAALLVETALRLAPKPGRQVWVLSTDLWTQTLALPTNRTVGLPAAELAGALNFEAEALSGHSAFESAAGFTFLKSAGGDNVYWIVQMKAFDREQVDEVVRKTGARLAGLCHPGGLPRSLYPTAAVDDSWERIELWPDAVVWLHGDGKGPPDVQVLNLDPRQGRWQGAVEKARGGLGALEHRELLAAEHIPTPAGQASEPVVQLDNPASLGLWLTAWAEHLAGRPADVPLIRPVVQPMSTRTCFVLALAVALVPAGLCAAHYHGYVQPRLAYLRTELQKAQAPKKELDDLEKKNKDLETKRDALQKQWAKLRQDNEALERQRRRLPGLLCLLAEQRCEHVVIQRIDSGAGEPRLHCLCLRPEMADEFARKLGQTLEPEGWVVEMAHKEARIVQNDGAPWAFELQLKEPNKNGANQTVQPPAPVRRR